MGFASGVAEIRPNESKEVLVYLIPTHCGLLQFPPFIFTRNRFTVAASAGASKSDKLDSAVVIKYGETKEAKEESNYFPNSEIYWRGPKNVLVTPAPSQKLSVIPRFTPGSTSS